MNYSASTTANVPSKHSSGSMEKLRNTNLPPGLPEDLIADLVSSDEEKENWTGIGIALLVIACILSLIVTSIILLTPADKGPRVKNERFRLEEILSGEYNPRTFNGSWISETEMVFRAPTGALVVFNAATLSQTTIISNVSFSQWNTEAYSLSADRCCLLVRTNSQYFTSRSYYAQYTIYNTSIEQKILALESAAGRLRFATWGPSGHQLAYVANGNLYYLPKQGILPKVITQSGRESTVLNGVPDISYEDLLNTNNALWWSEDGGMLAYLSLDLTDVNTVTRLKYGSFDEPTNINPIVEEQRYPKAGTPIPKVSVWAVDLREDKLTPKELLPPKSLRTHEYYVTSVSWLDNRRMLVIWTTRAQNVSVISICSSEKRWECEQHLEEKSSTGWVELNEPPVITSDKWFYFLRLPVTDGKAGNFRHVNMLDINQSKGFKTILTHGRFDVVKILAHRLDSRSVYYISTLHKRPGERHLFRVTDLRSPTPREVTCLTCNITKDCLYHDAVFSPGAKFFVLECLGPGIPYVEIWSVDLDTPVFLLDTNSDLKEKIDVRAMPQLKQFEMELSSGYDAQVEVLLPPGLCEEEIIKYPLLLQLDGSPGSQLVSQRFSIGWGTFLSSRKDIIFVSIDSRGSGFNGDRYLHELYRHLGTAEAWDPIEVISKMAEDLIYVDRERIGVWGWGYGGYSSVMTLASDIGTFACGMAVAPITNWRYYDAAFAERYMQSPKPEDNYIGYEKSSVNLKAANLKDKKFLLIHGTADEKVHFQHSIMLMKALIVAGLSFQTQVYPDHNHSLYGVKNHLHSTMEAFLDECFAKSKTRS